MRKKKIIIFSMLIISLLFASCAESQSDSSKSTVKSSSIVLGDSDSSSKVETVKKQSDDSQQDRSSKNDTNLSSSETSGEKKTDDHTISEAESIANMIVENESVWHKTDRLDSMFKETDLTIFDVPATTCWFEDLDFDGKKEFVVGPTLIIPGQALKKGYDIYKISETSIERVKGEIILEDKEASFFTDDFNHKQFKENNMGLFLYKSSNGKYHYVSLSPTSLGKESSMGLTVIDFNEHSNNKRLFSYYINNDITSFQVGDDTVSLETIIGKIKSEISGAKLCAVNIKQVALTNKTGQITADCYSKKTNEEKIKMLVESYNAYKIVESDKQPDFLDYMLKRLEEKVPKSTPTNASKLSDDEKRYKQVLDKYNKDIAAGEVYWISYTPITAKEIGYAFYDLNNDGIKELLIIPTNENEKKNCKAISELYSVVDNKPKKLLFSRMIGSNISIKQDNSIVLYERFSMFSGWYEKYNSLKTLLSSGKADERLDYDSTFGTPTYKYFVGGKEKKISNGEFQNIQNKWNSHTKTFNVKLFSEYK